MSDAINLATAENRDPNAAAADYWASARLDIVRGWVDELDPDTILDVGCGSGYVSSAVATSGRDVIGIDPDPEAISRAQRRSTPARFEQVLADEAPPGPFDAVLCLDVIEHVPPTEIWPEITNRLAPDGTAIVSVPAHLWLYGIHDDRQGHRTRFSRSQLVEEATEYGWLRPIRSRHTNAIPLVPYLAMQKLGIEPPAQARGENHHLIERVKQAALAIERQNPLPFGITLIAQFEI